MAAAFDREAGCEEMNLAVRTTGKRLNQMLAEAGLEPLDSPLVGRFESYLSLILRWNTRVNLTAIREEEDILAHHFVESIACGRALPAGIHALLDFGCGAGLPGIPIALCRPEIAVTLAESQGKKAAFLQEAVRLLGIAAKVHAHRAEELDAVFDCAILRAVDRMPRATKAAAALITPGGWLALMTTKGEVAGLRTVAGAGFCWEEPILLPGSEERLLALGRKVNSSV